MLSQTRRVSAKDAVISTIEHYITENGLAAGDSLPTEVELSKRLNVSRSVLREGMQYFRTLGIIGTKPKSGAYIKRLVPKNPFGGYLTFMRGDSRKLKEICQMRMALELGIIPFLIETVSESDLSKLESIAGDMRSANALERCELDVRFHSFMLKMVGNELMTGLIPLIVDFFEENNGNNGASSGKSAGDIANEHLDIVAALKKKDSVLLSDLIQSHYSSYLI